MSVIKLVFHSDIGPYESASPSAGVEAAHQASTAVCNSALVAGRKINTVGCEEGCEDGCEDGCDVGSIPGFILGCIDGCILGFINGCLEGFPDG